eukprot:7684076-Pyramimonas_sp.AAC.1
MRLVTQHPVEVFRRALAWAGEHRVRALRTRSHEIGSMSSIERGMYLRSLRLKRLAISSGHTLSTRALW